MCWQCWREELRHAVPPFPLHSSPVGSVVWCVLVQCALGTGYWVLSTSPSIILHQGVFPVHVHARLPFEGVCLLLTVSSLPSNAFLLSSKGTGYVLGNNRRHSFGFHTDPASLVPASASQNIKPVRQCCMPACCLFSTYYYTLTTTSHFLPLASSDDTNTKKVV